MNFRLIDYMPILLMFAVAAGFAITFHPVRHRSHLFSALGSGIQKTLVAAIRHAKFNLFRDAAVHRAAGRGFDLRNQKGRVRLEPERTPRGRSRSAPAGRIGSASRERGSLKFR